jgi:hypothetical protein
MTRLFCISIDRELDGNRDYFNAIHTFCIIIAGFFDNVDYIKIDSLLELLEIDTDYITVDYTKCLNEYTYWYYYVENSRKLYTNVPAEWQNRLPAGIKLEIREEPFPDHDKNSLNMLETISENLKSISKANIILTSEIVNIYQAIRKPMNMFDIESLELNEIDLIRVNTIEYLRNPDRKHVSAYVHGVPIKPVRNINLNPAARMLEIIMNDRLDFDDIDDKSLEAYLIRRSNRVEYLLPNNQRRKIYWKDVLPHIEPFEYRNVLIESSNSEIHVKSSNSEMHVKSSNSEMHVKSLNSEMHVKSSNSEMPTESLNSENIGLESKLYQFMDNYSETEATLLMNMDRKLPRPEVCAVPPWPGNPLTWCTTDDQDIKTYIEIYDRLTIAERYD